MNHKQFYLTLPSNTISTINNTASKYYIKLPYRLQLSGEWECALVEIVYPHTWENITFDDGVFTIQHAHSANTARLRIPPGYYESPTSLVSTLQWLLRNDPVEQTYPDLYKNVTFSYSTYLKRISIKFDSDVISQIHLTPKLAHILGFKWPDITKSSWADYPVDLKGGFESLYGYTNIIEPQIVGDIVAPLLRIVGIEGANEQIIDKIFDTPHYIPVLYNDISDIEVCIKTDNNEFLKFLSGKVVLKLHFRKVSRTYF